MAFGLTPLSARVCGSTHTQGLWVSVFLGTWRVHVSPRLVKQLLYTSYSVASCLCLQTTPLIDNVTTVCNAWHMWWTLHFMFVMYNFFNCNYVTCLHIHTHQHKETCSWQTTQGTAKFNATRKQQSWAQLGGAELPPFVDFESEREYFYIRSHKGNIKFGCFKP